MNQPSATLRAHLPAVFLSVAFFLPLGHLRGQDAGPGFVPYPLAVPFQQPTRLPDPRFRSPLGVWEIDKIASKVGRATGQRVRGRIVEEENVPFAGIRGPLDGGEIRVNPRMARIAPPNTWAFVIGHELAHRILDQQGKQEPGPNLEVQADILGARFALPAGSDLNGAHSRSIQAR